MTQMITLNRCRQMATVPLRSRRGLVGSFSHWSTLKTVYSRSMGTIRLASSSSALFSRTCSCFTKCTLVPCSPLRTLPPSSKACLKVRNRGGPISVRLCHPQQDDIAAGVRTIGHSIGWGIQAGCCGPWLDPWRGACLEFGCNSVRDFPIEIALHAAVLCDVARRRLRDDPSRGDRDRVSCRWGGPPTRRRLRIGSLPLQEPISSSGVGRGPPGYSVCGGARTGYSPSGTLLRARHRDGIVGER
jgi:hypothetical protein